MPGSRRTTQKMPFDRRTITAEEKQRLFDSVTKIVKMKVDFGNLWIPPTTSTTNRDQPEYRSQTRRFNTGITITF